MIRSPLFNDILSLRNTVDQLVNESFGGDTFRSPWSRSNSGGSVAYPMPLNVYATDEHVVMLAAVPGMQPDDLDLTIHQNTVTLSGSLPDVSESEEARNATWYVREFGGGSFRRSLTLPFPVDADHAEASFEQGVLRVTLPKAETAKPKKIALNLEQKQAIGAGQSNGSRNREPVTS